MPGGYEVSGDFTMHGVTKPVTFTMLGGKEIEAMGKKRVGFAAELKLKRSDYGFADTWANTDGNTLRPAGFIID